MNDEEQEVHDKAMDLVVRQGATIDRLRAELSARSAYAGALREAAEHMARTYSDWMAGCANDTRANDVMAAHIHLRDTLAQTPNPSGHTLTRGFAPITGEASGPVGLGPDAPLTVALRGGTCGCSVYELCVGKEGCALDVAASRLGAERFRLVPVDPTEAMVDAACRDVGLCDGDAKDEELRQEYRVAYRAMVGAASSNCHQMNSIEEDEGALIHAAVQAFGLLRRVRDRTDNVQFFEANAVMRMIEAALPKSMKAPEIGASPLMPERNNLATHDTVLRSARSCPKCGASNDAVGEVGSGCWTRGCDGQIVSNLTHPSQGRLP